MILIQRQIKKQTYSPLTGQNIILLDEVTYIKNWDKGIKFLADSGELEHTVMVISGSDPTIIKEARTRFPGRRGLSNKVDFHLYPLSFHDFVLLNKNINITQSEIGLLLTLDLPPSTE